MIFITLITLIICKALLNERLSFNFSYRITSIILLLTAFSNYNTLLNIEIVTGIGIYNGLFHITYITQIIETFLLIIGSIILISWSPTLKKYLPYNIQYNPFKKKAIWWTGLNNSCDQNPVNYEHQDFQNSIKFKNLFLYI